MSLRARKSRLWLKLSIYLTAALMVVGSICQGRDIYVFIPGYRGSAQDFTALKSLICDNQVCGIFNYDTGGKFGIADFVHQFSPYLQGLVENNGGLKSSDAIHIIGHSQGGLIALTWLRNALTGPSSEEAPLIAQVTSVSTLGTPLWGAFTGQLAEYGIKVPGLDQLLKLGSGPEASDLADNSDFIAVFRSFWSDPNFVNKIGAQHIRILNVSGYNAFGQYAVSSVGREVAHDIPSYFVDNDLVVETPASQNKFLDVSDQGITSVTLPSDNLFAPRVHSGSMPFYPTHALLKLTSDDPLFTNLQSSMRGGPVVPFYQPPASSAIIDLQVTMPSTSASGEKLQLTQVPSYRRTGWIVSKQDPHVFRQRIWIALSPVGNAAELTLAGPVQRRVIVPLQATNIVYAHF